MIANGIFMSKLIYVMPLWAGCENYIIKALQVIQNKAARYVTKCDGYTPIKVLLSQCGWLSVRQLGIYHSILLIYKTLQNKKPEYIYQKISTDFPRRTRIASTNAIHLGPQFDFEKELTRASFRWRATMLWNDLPSEIRKLPKVNKFKISLKKWIMEYEDI